MSADNTHEASERASADVDNLGQQTPGHGEQPFKALTAMRAIQRAHASNLARLVGYELAIATGKRGVYEATLPELAATLRVSRGSVVTGLKELVSLGLLRVQRRGSVANVYRWMPAAYAATKTYLPCASPRRGR